MKNIQVYFNSLYIYLSKPSFCVFFVVVVVNFAFILLYWPGHTACRILVPRGGLVAKSCPTLSTPWTVACQASLSMGFSRQEYWSGLPFPSPGIFPTQGSNPGLLHSRQILYWLKLPAKPLHCNHWTTREFPQKPLVSDVRRGSNFCFPEIRSDLLVVPPSHQSLASSISFGEQKDEIKRWHYKLRFSLP